MTDALASADAAARARAVDPQRSILLQAPAGSGKTTVLTQRFLRLLCAVDEPGAILAITFTLKAAAEMRARVTRALRGEIEASDPCAPQLRSLAAAALERAAARGWNLLENPAALRIQTIDSFNYWLASQLPLAARAGGSLAVIETPAQLYRRAARRTLAAADTDAQLADATELLFERLDNHWHRVERLLAQMLEKRGHWLRHVLGHDPQQLCIRMNASLAGLIGERLTALATALPRAARLAAQALPGVGPLSSEPRGLAAWRRLAFLTLTKAGWRRALSARLLGPEFEPPAARAALEKCIEALQRVPGFEALLQGAAKLPAATLGAADAAAIAALSRVLAHAAVELQSQFAEAGRVDYTYVTGAARAALTDAGEPTELALRTGLALRHILVDEFQDTSLAQFELLETLTVGWEEGDGRTLFVVGDPMQSIYRFRDAEVGLFLAARERGIGPVRLEPLRLTRNFRAAPALVTWTNQTFAGVFPAADDLRAGAVAFSASVATPRGPGQAETAAAAVSLRLFADEEGEAQAVAQHVAELKRRDPKCSVAILLSAHAHAAPIVAALDRRAIDWVGLDLVPLAQRPIVRDLVQLSRALHDLGDRNAWLALLRAPWCGARLATLSALSAPDPRQAADHAPLVWEALADPQRLARCAPGDQPRLARLRAVLTAALARRDEESAADWLESTWTQLGGMDAYAAADLEDARAFFAVLAQRAAALEWRGPQDFDSLLEDLYSAPQAGGAHALQIMTIHRAKGLEFDHVCVPALDRLGRVGERALLGWIDLPREHGESDLLMAPIAAAGDSDGHDLGALIHRLASARDAHERARLLYVAATRARRSLYLSAAPRPRADGSLKPSAGALLASLWPALAADFELDAAHARPTSGEPPPLPLRRLRDCWRAPEPTATAPLPHLPLGRASLETPEFSWVGETQRHIGTIVHGLLARVAGREPLPGGADIEAQRQAVIGQLRLHGVPEREQLGAARLIVEALTRTLGDERGRWILAGGREGHCELALTGVAGGRLQSVVIDRCFVDAGGTRWVVDYKTSRHEGGALEEFLEQEMQRYRAQLTSYVELARALGPEPVRAALYFPLLGVFRELR